MITSTLTWVVGQRGVQFSFPEQARDPQSLQVTFFLLNRYADDLAPASLRWGYH
jgi:hypothetical protein